MCITELQNILELILTGILTLATVILAWFTYKLVDESRKIRKFQAEPFISLTLENSETNATLLQLIVENIGQGSALNLQFDIIKDLSDYKGVSKLSSRGLFSEGMKFCPPGYKEKVFLTSLPTNYEEKIKEIIELKVNYSSIFQEQKSQHFELKLAQMKNTSKINPPDTYIGQIAKSLAEIKKIIEKKNK